MPDEVDHDNGVRSDNRINNLRDTSRAGNMKNKGKRKDNRSGVTGVGWHEKDRRWVAHITVGGKFRRLGGFLDKNEAIAARLKAEKELGFHEHHGRRKAHAL
ncbi:HNH endonuclease [Sinorhizobium meliloti]|uniref:HNH endonuclease n=1 Tax=Rhizobium meliloti TaxID=382 RepID=UPI00398CCE45